MFVVSELKLPTRSRVSALIHYSTASCVCLYGTIGVLGYMTFGAMTADNILLNYTGLSYQETLLFATGKVRLPLHLVSFAVSIYLLLLLALHCYCSLFTF